MKEYLKHYLACLFIFIAGGITFINLSLLIPVNESYQGAWENVELACFLGLAFSSMRYLDK